ncbi:MAG: sigma-70 family RNA polymerase sigma factor [Erysipelotrichales bacterium]|nr:sigma-70 family RNA polymerase sigma factor [Erysipelotrichales bacterium]MBQ1386155.1 sigma-70 family RNA polymerase sigma factor [Erysipelotrichales bacterium]MBQ2309271.1 sigma-70 family RNA polymerase sigma factor [Erysipelotrichales bacterium]MBQ4374923.1 sigma-70 family RNA polymerase sigma factor [Erysipelotrichales bacterium]MBQ5542675.1 sigma-70 family RNA polymerase sigma factor [Erysipelotrichales bacterium]
MEDEEIVRLYWNRDEEAIRMSAVKYGAYCRHIALNILRNAEDAEEAVNDTWVKAWNSIPPVKPAVLSSYLGKITRNLALDLYRTKRREKRGGETETVLEELGEIVSGTEDPEATVDRMELKEDIQKFLNTLPKEKKYMFLLRYWYAMELPEIAERLSVSENRVSVNLHRIRKQLKSYLEKRGYRI